MKDPDAKGRSRYYAIELQAGGALKRTKQESDKLTQRGHCLDHLSATKLEGRALGVMIVVASRNAVSDTCRTSRRGGLLCFAEGISYGESAIRRKGARRRPGERIRPEHRAALAADCGSSSRRQGHCQALQLRHCAAAGRLGGISGTTRPGGAGTDRWTSSREQDRGTGRLSDGTEEQLRERMVIG